MDLDDTTGQLRTPTASFLQSYPLLFKSRQVKLSINNTHYYEKVGRVFFRKDEYIQVDYEFCEAPGSQVSFLLMCALSFQGSQINWPLDQPQYLWSTPHPLLLGVNEITRPALKVCHLQDSLISVQLAFPGTQSYHNWMKFDLSLTLGFGRIDP